MTDLKSAAEKTTAAVTYETLVGLNYATAKGEVRAEAGSVIPSADLPALPERSIPWLLELGAIVARRADQ